MRSSCCLIFCLMQIFTFASANEGKYTVIAPGTIHSNDKYTAAVSVHNTAEPCQIKVGITGPSYNETHQIEVSENEVKNVEFDVPVLEKGDYNLTAEGVNCMENFKNSTKLLYAKFNTYVRIQTDKGMYKPGDEINFRAIFMDKDLKPAEAEKDSVIWFEDGKRNRIKEIKNFKTTKGVYTGKFQISEFPITGGWRLGVNNGARYDKTVYFDVNKYVLPKYLVKVEATESVSVKDGDMQVVVRANYTYGKPLNGKATVILTLGSGYYFHSGRSTVSDEENKPPPTLIKTGDMIQGKAKIDFNVKVYDAHLPYRNSPSYMGITATVEEDFTGVKINGSTSSTLFPYRYAMNCISYDTCSTFEVGKEKEVIFQINYIDGSNLKDTKTPIELIYKEVLRKNHWWHRERELDEDDTVVTTTMEPPLSDNRTVSFTGHMNETGFAIFKVALPDLPEYEGYSHYYSLELQYRDEQRDLYNTYQYREPKKVDPPKEEEEKPMEYFRLNDKYSSEKTLFLNKPDQFTLNSSQPIPYFDYNIVGRGNVLKSGRVTLKDKPKVYNLTLTPEILWAPNFAVYAYYVDDKGEYHYAEQRYHLDFELQNYLNISAAEQVKPGEEVALKIKTEPNSFVGLMAVDQSVLLLRANNDLSAHEFNWVLGSYSTNTPHQGGYSTYPGTVAGCVTLTNADYFYNRTRPDYMSSVADRGFVSNDAFNLKTAVASPQHSSAPGGVNYAASALGGPSGGGGGSSIQVRKDFSETWLFADIENTETEEFTWSKKIPETITSWVLTGFSLNPNKGLGVTQQQTKVKTFLPFFISIRLPYSVKRGEVINVPALVFNYLDKALDVEVTLDNTDDEYEFTDVSNEVIGDQKRSKTVRVPANGAAGVSFLVKPKVIGNVMLKYTAISPVAADAIHKSMKVVPEGITQYANRAYFVNLKEAPEQKSSFDLELPEDIVPDSEHVEVGVMGDILGPVLNNLDNLVRLPTGCGEQTMSSLLPNYLVMKYLKNSNRLTPTMERTLRYNMETGYQHMLNYRHMDGSFSSFGPPQDKDKPRNGSTWLTAYVVRSFQQIKEFVDVKDDIIDDGLAYLSKQQAENGTFLEKGDYFYASQRNHITLTGTALLAFLENSTNTDAYSKEIEKALGFIAQNMDKADSLQAQALGTYTLNRAKHPEAKEKLTKLKSLAKTESDRMWWSADNKRPISPRWWLYVFSNDVEITSYALLTIMDQESTKVDDIFPIVSWLIAQRNSYGGFSSTQDTVVGLTALIEFAKLADYQPAKMEVDISAQGVKEKKETVKLTEDNGILYQSVEMPAKTKTIDFNAKGTGTALVQIAYQYNIFEKEPKPSFTITQSKIDNNNSPSRLDRLICVKYVGEGNASNMAVLEISTPSGYVVEEDSLDSIKELERVSNTELKNSDSKLVIYFDHLYKDVDTCLMFEAFKTHAVAMQKPASIVLYDYYATDKKATEFYEIDSKLCDICEGEEECNKCK